MGKLPLYNQDGKSISEIEVSDEVFGLKPNLPVVHQVASWYLASRRSGTASSKTKGEVSGGGAKPWRQKGTGRARVGSIRSPLWKGGGVIFGPKPRDYSFSLPKKIRKLAIKVALSDKLREGKILVIEDLKVEAGKTKEMVKVLDNLKINKGLLVADKLEEKLVRASRNIEGVKLVLDKELNIHDLLNYDHLLLTQGAVKDLEEKLL